MVKKKKVMKLSRIELVSLRLTDWVGTTQSIVVHTILFIAIFGLQFFGVGMDHILLVLTTAVSLEAIYLALFIQMTVNRNTKSLQEVGTDIDEIHENVEDLGENLEELSEDIDDIQEDLGEIQADGDELGTHEEQEQKALLSIEQELKKIQENIEHLRKAGIIK